MPRLLTAFSLLALLSLPQVAEGAPKKKEGKKSPAPDFKVLMTEIVHAWESLDLDRVQPFYSQDPTARFFDLAPLEYVGWKAYRSGSTELFATFDSLDLELGDVQTHHGGKSAWGSATWKAAVKAKDGTVNRFEGRWTVIWEKRGSDWVVVHEHFSAPLPTLPG